MPENPADLSLNAIFVIALKNSQADTAGALVLQTAIEMIEKEIVVVGACWDYINEVYNRAGFRIEDRKTVWSGSKDGPYADPSLLVPGDWIKYKNLPYREISHSAIFVEWIDFERRSALTVEYIGRDREVPGWFREADLTKVYGILRGNG
jgi:hypothetical protein